MPAAPPLLSDPRTLAVVAIFGVVYLGMLLGGLPRLRLDRTGVALLGAIAIVAVGELSIEQCVAFTVDWAMGCPGVESWCSGHAPRLALECLRSADRRPACEALGDEVESTHFGYAECERMREAVEGRYTKRTHKKFCAAAYRAVAEHCRELL